MATRTISNAGGLWKETSAWAEGSVPTAADDVVATGTSGNLTISEVASCRSADFTSYVGTLKQEAEWKIGTSSVNGELALKLVAGMTYTIASGKITWASSAAGVAKITTAGKVMPETTFSGGGSWQLQDTYETKETNQLVQLSKGTLDLNGKTLNCSKFVCTGENTRKLIAGASAINLFSSAATTVWDFSTKTNATVEVATSTITIKNAGSNAKTFAGGGFTYGTLSVTVGGTGAIIFTGSNTFAKVSCLGSASGGKTLTFTAGTTQTILTAAGWEVSGVAGKIITIQSDSAGSSWALKIVNGIVSRDYLSLKDSKAEGGAAFYAGTNSTSVSGNSGWSFSTRLVKLCADVGHGTQTLAMVNAFHALIAPRKLDRLMFYTGFDQSLLAKYMKELSEAAGVEEIVLAWDPVGGDGTLHQVVNHAFDAYLTEQANACKTWGKPLIIRIAHEFNGNWHSTWGTFHESAAEFIAGWKYIVEYFASKGVTNVKWAWNPNIWGGASTQDPTTYYPGDLFVDLIGLDGYMKRGATIKQPAEIFQAQYELLTAIAPTKPFDVYETGCAEDERFSKAEWFSNLFALIANTIPVTSLGYWNRFEEEDNSSDYSIDSSLSGGATNHSALAAFQAGVNAIPFTAGTGVVAHPGLLEVGLHEGVRQPEVYA